MKKMCAYCVTWHDSKDLTPMTEEGKTHVLWYCDKCLPGVKIEIYKMNWYKKYHFGIKGQEPK